MSILFVYPEVSEQTGGGVFTKVIRESLKNSYNDYYEYSFPLYPNGKIKLFSQLNGYTMGMTKTHLKNIIKIIKDNNIDTVILNSSRIGVVAKKVKKKFDHVKVLTIFHNVEVKFCYNAFLVNHNPFSLLTVFVTWINEKNSVRYSNIIATLNKRDSETLNDVYKRCSDSVLPLCLIDRFNINKYKDSSNTTLVGGFIGSNFYANNKGVKWFCENVLNQIDCKIQIIGKGFEKENDYFSKFSNIELIGTVDNLDDYYYQLDFIVSPIFDGSGMKTKTAEALMFGKTILGSNEAFEGYDVDYSKVGALCNTADEFVYEIKKIQTNGIRKFNEYSRHLFVEKYSGEVLKQILLNILK